MNKDKRIQFDLKSLNPLFGTRTKVLKGKTSELTLAKTSVIETTCHDLSELTFLCISEPEQDTLENINKKYKFHHLAIEDCLSEFQRSKIEQYKDYIHLILQVPMYEKNQVITAEVDIFVSETYVVLVHWDNLPHLTEFINMVVHDDKTKKESMEKGPGYLLYKIIDLLVLNSFPLMDKIEKRVRVLENKVFDENSYKLRFKQ